MRWALVVVLCVGVACFVEATEEKKGEEVPLEKSVEEGQEGQEVLLQTASEAEKRKCKKKYDDSVCKDMCCLRKAVEHEEKVHRKMLKIGRQIVKMFEAYEKCGCSSDSCECRNKMKCKVLARKKKCIKVPNAFGGGAGGGGRGAGGGGAGGGGGGGGGGAGAGGGGGGGGGPPGAAKALAAGKAKGLLKAAKGAAAAKAAGNAAAAVSAAKGGSSLLKKAIGFGKKKGLFEVECKRKSWTGGCADDNPQAGVCPTVGGVDPDAACAACKVIMTTFLEMVENPDDPDQVSDALSDLCRQSKIGRHYYAECQKLVDSRSSRMKDILLEGSLSDSADMCVELGECATAEGTGVFLEEDVSQDDVVLRCRPRNREPLPEDFDDIQSGVRSGKIQIKPADDNPAPPADDYEPFEEAYGDPRELPFGTTPEPYKMAPQHGFVPMNPNAVPTEPGPNDIPVGEAPGPGSMPPGHNEPYGPNIYPPPKPDEGKYEDLLDRVRRLGTEMLGGAQSGAGGAGGSSAPGSLGFSD